MPARSPISFRCSKCRSTLNSAKGTGRANRVALTGGSKPHARQGRYQSSSHAEVALEYRCSECGHLGWSTHKDLALYAAPAVANQVPDDSGPVRNPTPTREAMSPKLLYRRMKEAYDGSGRAELAAADLAHMKGEPALQNFEIACQRIASYLRAEWVCRSHFSIHPRAIFLREPPSSSPPK